MMLSRIFNKNSVVQELMSSSFWSIVGTLISKFLLFFIWIFIARVLAPKLYGEFSIIKSTTLMFVDFVGMSFSLAATKYIAENYLSDQLKVERFIGLFLSFGCLFGLFAFAVVFFCADIICEELLHANHLSGLLRISSLVLFSSLIGNIQLGILRGFNEYKLVAKINLYQVIFSIPFFIVCTLLWSVKGAVISYVVYNTVICFIAQAELNSYCKKNHIKPSVKNIHNEIKLVFNYIIPYLLSILFTTIAQWYNETKLVTIESTGFIQLGYYSAITVIQTTIIAFAVMVCSPFVPLIAKYKNKPSVALLERLNILVPLYTCMLITIILILFPEVLTLFYGKEYANDDVYILTVLISLSTIFIIFRQSVNRLIAVYEKQWLFLIDSIILSLSFVLGFHLLFKYGAQGLAITFLLSYLLLFVTFTPIYIKSKLISISILKDKLLIFLVISIIISLLIFMFFSGSLLIKIIWLIITLCVISLGLYSILKEYGIEN